MLNAEPCGMIEVWIGIYDIALYAQGNRKPSEMQADP